MALPYGGDVGYDLAMAAERVRQQEEHIHQQTRIIEDYKARAKAAEQLTAMETEKRQANNDELDALRQQQLLAGEQRLQPNIHVTETSITSRPTPSKKAKRALFSPEASEDDKIRDAIQQLAKIAINDNSLMPKVFNGKRLDPDAMDRWIEHFHRFTAFKQLEDEGKLDLFKLLMTEQAADWLKSLPPETTDDFDTLLDAFKQRFAHTKLQRWRTATSIWKRSQKPTESVDEFITAIKNTARQITGMDDTQIIYAILQGLKPSIRAHVLQQKHETLHEVETAARVAEEALRELNSDNTVVADLTKVVATLVDQFSQQPSASRAHHYDTAPNTYLSDALSTPRDQQTHSRAVSPLRPRFNNARNQPFSQSAITPNSNVSRSPSRTRQWQPPPQQQQYQRQWTSVQNAYRRPQQQQPRPTPSNGGGRSNFGRPPSRPQSPGPQTNGNVTNFGQCGNCTRTHAQGQCFA